MDLGLYTDSVDRLSFTEALDLAAQIGARGIEIAAGGQSSAPHLRLGDLTAAGARARFSAAFEARGLHISALNCSAWPLHPVVGEEHAELIRATIRLAGQLGVRKIVTMSGNPGDGRDATTINWVWYPWPSDAVALRERQWEAALPFWRSMAGFAADHGVERIAFELHPLHLAYNVPTLLRFRDAVGPIIGANVDPSHMFWQQMDPLAVVRALGSAVHHVHLKDTQLVPDQVALAGVLDQRPFTDPADRAWVFRTVGRGHGREFWAAFVAALIEVGYDDVLSIENEDASQPAEAGVREAATFMRSIIPGSRPGARRAVPDRDGRAIKVPAPGSYFDQSGRDDVLSGGVKLIPISTPKGDFRVWTKRIGNNPKVKVLLLHGGPGATHEYFEACDSYFPAAGIEYYYYDQLGSTYSDHPDDPDLWEIPRFVEEVEQVRQALGLDRDDFYLLGHSWGGALAIEYALKYQQHLKALVISNMMSSIPAYNAYAEGVLMPTMDQEALAEIKRLEAAKAFDDPRYVELLMQHHYVHHVLRRAPEAWPEPVSRSFAHINPAIYVPMQGPSELGASGKLLTWDRTADLPNISVPTLVIGARYDTMDPGYMEMMAGKVQRGTYLLCPDGSHMAMYDDQVTYFGGIVDFIGTVERGAIASE